MAEWVGCPRRQAATGSREAQNPKERARCNLAAWRLCERNGGLTMASRPGSGHSSPRLCQKNLFSDALYPAPKVQRPTSNVQHRTQVPVQFDVGCSTFTVRCSVPSWACLTYLSFWAKPIAAAVSLVFPG